MKNNKTICLFIPHLKKGGAENLTVNLANLFIKNEFTVKLVILSDIKKNYELNSRVDIINFNKKRTFYSFFAILNFLLKSNKMICISSLKHINIILIIVNLLLMRKHYLISIETNTFSNHKLYTKKYISFYLITFLSQILYPFLNFIITPSFGVYEEIKQYLFIDNKKIKKIFNPIDIKYIKKLSTLNIPKEFNNKNKNIVAVGRLTWEKDYETLIKSMKFLIEVVDANLYIIGEGILYKQLNKLINDTKLNKNVFLLGYVDNPYIFIKNADLFVLSSISEGLPTSLIEALILQPNIISTNCKYGPAEILQNGKFGKLIPQKQPILLSKEIANSLSRPIKKNNIDNYINTFSEDNVLSEYIKIISKLK